MEFTEREIDRIIEMAWEDRTPFDAIEFQFGISEKKVITLMRRELKEKSFKRWRRRAQQQGRNKHRALRQDGVMRFKCSRQKSISSNKIT